MRKIAQWFCRSLLILGVGLGGVFGESEPVQAQSLFERLFGAFKAQKPRSVLRAAPRAPGSRQLRTADTPYIFSPYRREGGEGFSKPRRWRSSGRYRSVCVRLCDGYFFPIRHGVSRGHLYNDADKCRRRCTSETRLFVMPVSSSKIKDAVDQRGLGYDSLENAFLYRKKLIKSCTCRAKPWSYSERARHDLYAANEVRALAAKRLEKEQAFKKDTGGAGSVSGGVRTMVGIPRTLGIQAVSHRRRSRKRWSRSKDWALGFGGSTRYRWPGDD